MSQTGVADRVSRMGSRWSFEELPTAPGTAIQFPRTAGGRILAMLGADGRWHVVVQNLQHRIHYTRWIPVLLLAELSDVETFEIIPTV